MEVVFDKDKGLFKLEDEKGFLTPAIFNFIKKVGEGYFIALVKNSYLILSEEEIITCAGNEFSLKNLIETSEKFDYITYEGKSLFKGHKFCCMNYHQGEKTIYKPFCRKKVVSR